jgi:solute carrier family 25 thiamine pyrophosphate transporter 19
MSALVAAGPRGATAAAALGRGEGAPGGGGGAAVAGAGAKGERDAGWPAVQHGAAQAAAGGLSGLVSRTVVAPLDVLKIRLQLQAGREGARAGEGASAGAGAGAGAARAPYRGMVDAARRIAVDEGLRGLYKGTVPGLALWFVYAGVQFPVQAWVKQWLQKAGLERSVGSGACSFASGALASAVATVVSYPLDTVRTQWVFRHDSALRPRAHLLAHARSVLREEGPRGFFRGLVPALAQVVPGMALSFWFFDEIKRARLAGYAGAQTRLSPADSALAGGIAGVLSKLAVYPLDTAKKRLQASHLLALQMAAAAPPTAGAPALYYRGLADCARRTLREEGLAGLYKGTVPTVLKAALASAATFSTYEAVLHRMTPPAH